MTFILYFRIYFRNRIIPLLVCLGTVDCFGKWNDFGTALRIEKMEVPVLLYILVILIMSGVAWEHHFQLELPQTYFAVLGSTLFILSEALLAWNRFKVKFKSA
jgi:uncharacterized membrane protein YhhN